MDAHFSATANRHRADVSVDAMDEVSSVSSSAAASRVVILGGGFGGLYAALRLQSLLRGRRDVDVTLVNRENFFLFTPMLPQVATSGLDTRHIVATIRRICPRIRFYEADVKAVDFANKTVTIVHSGARPRTLPYDQLLLALGSVTNFFGIPGLAEHALTMKSLSDAIRLRNHALDMLERAELETDAGRRRELLTFVVAGAGFAGIETAAELDIFMRRAARSYRSFTPADIRTVIVDAQDRILPELSPTLAQFTLQTLQKRGVEFHLNAKVAGADASGVTLHAGERIATHTLVWTGGVAAHPFIATLPGATSRGRLPTEPTLAMRGSDRVWAVGDCAEVLDAQGKPYPPTAQHALREGGHAGDNILAAIDGRALRPFAFTAIGQMANLGRHRGVAMVGGLKISGFPAWWLWRTYYLSRLPTLDKKIRVAIDWTLDLFFARDTVRLSLPEPKVPSAPALSANE